MRHLRLLSLAIITAFLLYSCDPCNNLDCISDNYYGQFRIVRATDGKDMVFGPAKIYDKDQIEFYSVKGADTTFLDYETIKFPGTGYDSILYVRFFPKADIVYMRLSASDVDTISVSYNTFNTRCCGSITEIKNFRLNNLIDIPGNKGTQEIMK